MQNPFTQHPHSVNESYFQHFICASGFGIWCIIAGVAVIIHAIFPFVFEHTASNIVVKLNKKMQQRVECAKQNEQNQ